MSAYEKLGEWLDSGVKLYTPYLTTEDVKECVEALEKQQKYAWHDLRKNPEDLPSEDTDSDFFMCCLVGDSGQGYIYDHGYEICGYFGSWDAPGRAEVVAWREIEPFEE